MFSTKTLLTDYEFILIKEMHQIKLIQVGILRLKK